MQISQISKKCGFRKAVKSKKKIPVDFSVKPSLPTEGNHWRIYIGRCPVHAPSWGSRFFRFDIQNFQNVTASGVHTPPKRSTPPLWEILDPPLVTPIFCYLLGFCSGFGKRQDKVPFLHYLPLNKIIISKNIFWCGNHIMWKWYCLCLLDLRDTCDVCSSVSMLLPVCKMLHCNLNQDGD